MKSLFASALAGLLLLHPGVGRADEPTGSRAAKSADTSNEARVARDARAVVALMEGSARGLADLLGKARRTGDTRSVRCVNESLSQANVLTRQAKERYGELVEAVQRRDEDAEARLLALIKEDRAMERDASRTAFACVGVVVLPRGKDVVTVQVTVDKGIAPEVRRD
jgi:hypothetical protein